MTVSKITIARNIDAPAAKPIISTDCDGFSQFSSSISGEQIVSIDRNFTVNLT